MLTLWDLIPTRRKPDITLAKKHLNNWEPNYPLEEGLKKTIAYFRELLETPGDAVTTAAD